MAHRISQLLEAKNKRVGGEVMRRNSVDTWWHVSGVQQSQRLSALPALLLPHARLRDWNTQRLWRSAEFSVSAGHSVVDQVT